MTSSLPVLAIDDEWTSLQACKLILRMEGIENVICCQDARKAMAVLAQQKIGVVLLDLFMPHISGLDLLGKICQEYPDVPVIVVTGASNIETAVECMRSGAFDYMVKPIERSRLLSGVERAFEVLELRQTCADLAYRLQNQELLHPEVFAGIVTQDPAMHAVFQCVEAVAPSSRPVLITGETGVGKEMIARTLHTLSGREGQFIAVNVAGLDDTLFSDTLFGHRKGAFTGADKDHPGLIAQAKSGTLFLDEIGDLSSIAQIKLLRLIQEKEFYPLGSAEPESTDARILVATHQDLGKLQVSGRFRKDLYYRLKCHHIHIPPLRQRRNDIRLLVDYFLTQASATMGKKAPVPAKGLFDLLATYSFPGNVRELESMVFDAVSKHTSGMLSTSTFSQRIQSDDDSGSDLHEHPEESSGKSPFTSMTHLPTLEETEWIVIHEALRRANGNQTVAARLLGISQPALSKRLKRHPVH
ncbi:MAG TPA: sigma-54 dependent transcriptional regulator [Candidatus Hydrogenedentes bacterium]|nr:sigma-54 dependent transcriptional regulator [Candidatus Hydrogenedentota bacterium]